MPHKRFFTQQDIDAYRQQTYCCLPGTRFTSKEDAVDFVKRRGFVFFWPIKGVPFASLWSAVAGDRPVPNNHDDPGHVTWRWKDELLGSRKWYYAKILRRKSTIISLNLVENFISLSEGAFQGIEDIEYLYKIGKRSRLELELLAHIIEYGPIDSIDLRQRLGTRLTFTGSEFSRALEKLQTAFQILPMGISENGRWNYAYLFDTVEHYFPELIKRADQIDKRSARESILGTLFSTNGVADIPEIKKVLQWEHAKIEETIESLCSMNMIHPMQIKDSDGTKFASTEFMQNFVI